MDTDSLAKHGIVSGSTLELSKPIHLIVEKLSGARISLACAGTSTIHDVKSGIVRDEGGVKWSDTLQLADARGTLT